MATQFDFASLGNMFGGGGVPTGLDALLTEDQRKLLGRNAALSAAGALLQASGRSATPISLGQALGGALQAGQQGYQQARAGSFQDLMLGAKLKESEREAAANESWTRFLGGGVSPVTSTGVAQAMPTGVGVPTAERDMAMPMAAPAPSGILATLSPEQRALLTSLPRKEGVSEVLKMSQAQSEFGEPKPEVRDGKVTMVQYNKLGQSRIATGAMPYEAQSPDIRAVEYIRGQPLAGTGQAGIGQVGQYRQQIAPKTNVEVKMPGNQQFLAGVGGDVSKTLNELTMGARTANDSLANIDRILPALDKAIVGPGADYRTAMLRIGQQLNVAGADANEQLANTRAVVQGLAQRELDEAKQTSGQGSLTGPEREMLRKAAAGDQTLSAAEIKQALSTAQKVARNRLAVQQDYLQRASNLPGFEQFAPMYKVTPYGSGGGGNPLLNAIDQQLQINSGVKK